MKTDTKQLDKWCGAFGEDYTSRNTFKDFQEFENLYVNRYGIKRTDLNKEWIGRILKNSKILEVGTNLANQLKCLEHMGYENLYGIEAQENVVKQVRQTHPQLQVIRAFAQDIPYKDNFFDLVFTNNVLIHISPEDINSVIDEIYRVSKKYIWGFEYYSDEYVEINYRGNEQLLWKADYCKLFQMRYPSLKLINSELMPCLDERGNMDKIFLLEK